MSIHILIAFSYILVCNKKSGIELIKALASITLNRSIKYKPNIILFI